MSPRIEDALCTLKELHATWPAVEFGCPELKAVRMRMIKLGWTRTNINQQVKRILRMTKWAAIEELVPPAIHENLGCFLV